jgi:hypothetical protein
MIAPVIKYQGVNPMNYRIVIQRALEYRNQLELNSLTFRGASASYTQKKKWENAPKVTLHSSEGGKKSHNIKKPSTQLECKALVAILYSLGHIENALRSCNLFYNDKKGKVQSIATKHGPEHSDYMKELIAILNEPGFVESIESSFETPLPEDLKSLEIELLESLFDDGEISNNTVHELKKKHACDELYIEEALGDLRNRTDLGNRQIPVMNLESIPAIEHLRMKKDLQEQIEHLKDSKDELIDEKRALQAEMKSIDIDLKDSRVEVQKLMNRSLWARILNKKA